MHATNKKACDSLAGMNTNVLQKKKIERYFRIRTNTTNSKITKHWKPERLAEYDMRLKSEILYSHTTLSTYLSSQIYGYCLYES